MTRMTRQLGFNFDDGHSPFILLLYACDERRRRAGQARALGSFLAAAHAEFRKRELSPRRFHDVDARRRHELPQHDRETPLIISFQLILPLSAIAARKTARPPHR